MKRYKISTDVPPHLHSTSDPAKTLSLGPTMHHTARRVHSERGPALQTRQT